MHMRHHKQNQNGTPKGPEKSLILERSGNQYVAMVTKLLTWYCGAHLVESYCKESNISDTNWLRYCFSSYLINILLSVWRHHWANLHILKTWISLERKEIFENSNQHFFAYRLLVYVLIKMAVLFSYIIYFCPWRLWKTITTRHYPLWYSLLAPLPPPSLLCLVSKTLFLISPTTIKIKPPLTTSLLKSRT